VTYRSLEVEYVYQERRKLCAVIVACLLVTSHLEIAVADTTIVNRDGRSTMVFLGAGLAYQRGRSILSLDYRGQFSSDYEHHIIGARLVYAFR